ncbi:MAG: hypothetical protein N3A64_04945, partial [Desulfobacterota bacterium]|nr:hypothetical protein [Thermodesulfobacteriota bacterium]
MAKSQKRTQTPRFLKKGFEKNGTEVKLICYRKLQHFLGKYLTEKYLIHTYHRFQPQLVFIFGTNIPLKVLR